MKYAVTVHIFSCQNVAPFTGAWIEILMDSALLAYWAVAPFMGAWIEMGRETRPRTGSQVAPFTGAWIEIG